MICPKCGFNQPDELYCAMCGVHVEKFAQRKRRHRLRAGFLSGFIAVAALVALTFIYSERPSKDSLGLTNVSESPIASPDGDYLEAKGAPESSNPERPGVDSIPEQEGAGSESAGSGQSADSKSSPEAPSPEGGPPSPAEKKEQESHSARYWLDKGLALDDDSETEIECYKKAVELDPELAPAHFRLGAIYHRQANYDLADDAFAKFLAYATDAEKQYYDIYVYYSLADVERLIERNQPPEPAESGAEAEKTGTSPATEKESEGAGEETATSEQSEEVRTVVKFSSMDGHIIVPVVLDGFYAASMLVDTGAGISILSKESARRLNLADDSNGTITLKTVGTDVQATLAELYSIQVGTLTHKNFRVAVTELPLGDNVKLDGILGMDFMKDYTIQIDNKQKNLILFPKAR